MLSFQISPFGKAPEKKILGEEKKDKEKGRQHGHFNSRGLPVVVSPGDCGGPWERQDVFLDAGVGWAVVQMGGGTQQELEKINLE